MLAPNSGLGDMGGLKKDPGDPPLAPATALSAVNSTRIENSFKIYSKFLIHVKVQVYDLFKLSRRVSRWLAGLVCI